MQRGRFGAPFFVRALRGGLTEAEGRKIKIEVH